MGMMITLLLQRFRELEGMQFVLISSIFPAVLLDGALSLWEWEKLEVLHHRWGGGSHAHYPTPFAQFHRFTAVQYQQYQLAWSDGWGAGAWMGQLLVRVRRLTAKSSNSLSFWLQDDVSRGLSRSIRWQVCFRSWLLKKELGLCASIISVAFLMSIVPRHKEWLDESVGSFSASRNCFQCAPLQGFHQASSFVKAIHWWLAILQLTSVDWMKEATFFHVCSRLA